MIKIIQTALSLNGLGLEKDFFFSKQGVIKRIPFLENEDGTGTRPIQKYNNQIIILEMLSFKQITFKEVKPKKHVVKALKLKL